jgi:hypothetical protein
LPWPLQDPVKHANSTLQEVSQEEIIEAISEQEEESTKNIW